MKSATFSSLVFVSAAVLLTSVASARAVPSDADRVRIQPYAANPAYWQYRGEPVMLIGGTDQDNLFNHPDSLVPAGLGSHLDLLVASGGNYVRNTMSSRDEGNLWPFAHDKETGLYDLNRFDEEYWQRFGDFLRLAHERNIIVQIEFFDPFDYYGGNWLRNPYRPDNNINYTAEESGLASEYPDHPSSNNNLFFHSSPELEDLPLVLAAQEAFVARALSLSLPYGNVLYCISNETSGEEEWSRHWARFIRQKADEAGVSVHVTEMWGHHNLNHHLHRRTFDYPDLYSFVDISQNNHKTGQTHWDHMVLARERLVSDPVRPVNNVKIYGGVVDGERVVEGTRRFWRNVFAGCASSRFHRPGSGRNFRHGIGLGEVGQTNLRSMRRFLDHFDIFASEPANSLLSEREPDEAYCAVVPGRQFALYFPDGGDVRLDLAGVDGLWTLRWLDVEGEQWIDGGTLRAGGTVHVAAPETGQWTALIEPSGG